MTSRAVKVSAKLPIEPVLQCKMAAKVGPEKQVGAVQRKAVTWDPTGLGFRVVVKLLRAPEQPKHVAAGVSGTISC